MGQERQCLPALLSEYLHLASENGQNSFVIDVEGEESLRIARVSLVAAAVAEL